MEDPRTVITQLRDTLGKMETALDAIEEAIVWTDASQSVHWCNAAFERLLDRSRVQTLGRPLWRLLPLSEHGALLPPEAHPAHRILRERRPFRGLYGFAGKEGGPLTVEVSGTFLLLERQTECAVLVIRDVTDDRELEQVRIQSRALSAAANAIAIVDDTGSIEWVNPAFTDLTGYSFEEAFHQNMRILKSGVHGEAFYRELWKTVRANKTWKGDLVNRRKDGSLYVEEQTITPVTSGKGTVRHFIAIKQDISQRRKDEDTLREKEARIRAILACAVDAIITIDETGTVDAFNPAAEKMFGYEAGEVLRRKVNMLMPPEHTDRHDGYIRRYLETGQARVIGISRETEGRKKSGDRFPMELALSEVVLSDRRLFTAVVRDITERKRAEAIILEANRRLEENRKKMEADLRVAGEIQQNLLPKGLPDVNGVRMAWQFAPCHFVGGDIFNILQLGPDHLAVYVIDVSGHGVPSAFVAVSVWQLLQGHTGFLRQPGGDGIRPPAQVMSALDGEFPMERFEKYFTMFYLVLDLRDGTLRYCNAAHPRPYLLRRTGERETLEEGGTVVGLGGAVPFEEGSRRMEPGDQLFLFTDGVTEYGNEQGEMFGLDRLEDCLSRHRGAGADRLSRGVYDALMTFGNRRETEDDISLLVLDFQGRPRVPAGPPAGR